MKKIINGKVYNTETARKVAEHEHSYRTEFDWCDEALYCKRTGEYFLAGRGHAQSRYACQVEQNCWAPGEGIIPLTYAEAKEWGEAHMDAEDYEAEFGPVSEGELTHLHISVPSQIADVIRKAAKTEGLSISECIARRFS